MSKANFTYCIRNQECIIKEGEVKNNSKAIGLWLESLQKTYPLTELVIGVEHTGIYTWILLRTAREYGIDICLEGALNIKRSLGLQRGKNDQVDALRIAEYMMRYWDRLQLWKPKRKIIDQLLILQRCRNRLVKAKKQISRFTRESEQFIPADDHDLSMECTEGSVQQLQRDIQSINDKISQLIDEDQHLSRLKKIVTSVTGVGDATFVELVIRTNEFKDHDNAKKMACHAGVAPFEHSSGSSIRGKTRVSHNAHKDMKTLLHLCAMAAVRVPGELQQYYQRKVSEGKNKMSVLNAVRNKLLHRIFAVVRDNVMYQKNYQYCVA